MLSYLTNLILSFLLLATISKSQSTTSSTSTTTVAPVTSTTSTSTSSTSSTSASTTSTTGSSSSTTASTTHASNATNGSSVTTITLIKNNATSNYLLWPFAGIDDNYTLPFAIGKCSSYNMNGNFYLKPMCVSNNSVNVTFYNNSGCTSKPQRFELISNTSVFRCNASSNYAELAMSPNTTCPGKFKTYVGINYCFPTEYGYASFLCSGKNVQYVSFNSSSCLYNGLLTISQVNSTLCGPLFFNESIYTSLSTCINNVTTPSTTSTSTSTGGSTSSTTSTTKASTTSTTGKVTTSSTTGGSTSTSTTQSTTRTSSGSSVFILNNVVYILSIITIFNIIS